MPAEVYADSPDQLERLLRYVPEHQELPVVHLNRGVNLLDPRGRATVETFVARFAGRVYAVVVHDKAAMLDRMPEVVEGMRRLGGTRRRPLVLLEYAAGLDPAWYVELSHRLVGVESASCCLDLGHLGIQLARQALSRACPDLSPAPLTPDDPRLPDVVTHVEQATRTALPGVLELLRAIGPVGKPVHLHLHDGHPLIPGLSDHFSFLTRVPVPFEVNGRRSLDPMYGPAGLAAVLRGAVDSFPDGAVSSTLEIHQVEGRLPLRPAEAAGLFGHWQDLTNAERTNYWLSVMADNYTLARLALTGSR